MRLFSFTTLLLAGSPSVFALALPKSSLSRRDIQGFREFNPDVLSARFEEFLISDLEKRRGGGGGGARGGSSGGSGGSSSSGGSSGGSGSSGSGSGGASSGSKSPSSFSSGSNAGGSTVRGSGATPPYGGGRYYGGGATSPYSSGLRSPLGITPFLLPLAALSIFPGLWLYGAYAYPYSQPYYFHNTTATNSTDSNGTVQALPVTCLCQQYSVCGCDDNSNNTFLDSLLPNGTDAQNLNQSLIQINNVNGTETIVLNGTLPNGTTAPGGTDPSSVGTRQIILEHSGYWVVAAIVYWTVWML